MILKILQKICSERFVLSNFLQRRKIVFALTKPLQTWKERKNISCHDKNGTKIEKYQHDFQILIQTKISRKRKGKKVPRTGFEPVT